MLIALIIAVIIVIFVIYVWYVTVGEADVRVNVIKNRNSYCDGDCKFCNSQDICKFKEEERD